MKHIVSYVLLLILAVAGISAHAEGGCPAGSYPQSGQGWQTCVPIPGYGQSQTQAISQPALPSWEDQWGAIARDAGSDTFGSVTGRLSESEATKDALSDCQSRGGKECFLGVAYANGCAALVVGDSVFNFTAAKTARAAGKSGIERCSKDSTNCRVSFTACSPPRRIR